MKKTLWILALAAMTLASCTEKENNEEGANLAEQMIGKWMLTQFNGNTLPTNGQMVYTFESETEGYLSASRVDYSDTHPMWSNHLPSDVLVEGNDILMNGYLNKTTSFTAKLGVTSISSTEMHAESEYSVYHNGQLLLSNIGVTLWTKVKKDYSTDIIGTWEGHVTNNEGSEFDDGELHRWEYFADGTYIYYHLDADSNWTPQASEFSEYFVDGVLLCTRWKNSGEGEEEHREWWEISSITNGVMNWTALRLREDGTSYTATFQMTKVQ